MWKEKKETNKGSEHTSPQTDTESFDFIFSSRNGLKKASIS